LVPHVLNLVKRSSTRSNSVDFDNFQALCHATLRRERLTKNKYVAFTRSCPQLQHSHHASKIQMLDSVTYSLFVMNKHVTFVNALLRQTASCQYEAYLLMICSNERDIRTPRTPWAVNSFKWTANFWMWPIGRHSWPCQGISYFIS